MNLPIPTIVLALISELQKAGFEAFIVGGAVRDLLLKKETIRDWDITTNATPDQIMPLFKNSFNDNAFGTVMVAPEYVAEQFGLQVTSLPFDVFDITTYRTEARYSDRRRPDSVSWGKTLEEDLRRRDFTINAIALKLSAISYQLSAKKLNAEVDCKIIDPYMGQEDLEKKLIRAVGNPTERFNEDALRMMRAIRFGATLGFLIETETLAALTKASKLIGEISFERIRDELLKIIGSPYPTEGIQLLLASGLLEQFMPEMLATRGVTQAGRHKFDVWTHSLESLRTCPSTDPIVRLATLLHDIGKPKTQQFQGPRGVTFYGHEVVGARIARRICERLRLSKKQIDKVFVLVRWHMFTYSPEMTDAAIRRFIRRVGVENINDMMLLRVGDRKGGGSKATSWRFRELQQRIGENLYEPMSVNDLKIDGHDVMDTLGIKPGPKIGQILNQLFEEVMEDTSKNNRDYLVRRAKELHTN